MPCALPYRELSNCIFQSISKNVQPLQTCSSPAFLTHYQVLVPQAVLHSRPCTCRTSSIEMELSRDDSYTGRAVTGIV